MVCIKLASCRIRPTCTYSDLSNIGLASRFNSLNVIYLTLKRLKRKYTLNKCTSLLNVTEIPVLF